MGVGATRSARNQGLMRNVSQQLASWRGSTKHCDSRSTARKARAAARALKQLHLNATRMVAGRFSRALLGVRDVCASVGRMRTGVVVGGRGGDGGSV